MTAHSTALFRRLALLVAVALPFALTSCDSTDSGGGGENTFLLPSQRVEFDFEFDGGDLDAEVLNDVFSENTVNLIDFIEDEGFTVDDVVSVTIAGNAAEFRIAQPPFNAGVNGFDEVRVSLRPEGASSAGSVVATGSGFNGASDTANLDLSTTDFATIVQTGAFEARLQLDPSALIQDTDYRIEVSFNVSVEVEG